MKQKAKLTCRVTGQTRQSSHKYIAKKAEQYNTSSDEWQKYYVSKPALLSLQAELRENPVSDVLNKYEMDGSTLEKVLKYNGKSKKKLDDYKGKKLTVTREVQEEAVAAA
tara:strand:+ start:418 stop:747 length:330 start_codon:yes stop_codon:yes gene_type:complete